MRFDLFLPLEVELALKPVGETLDWHPDLLHRIALTNGDALVFQRIKIKCDAIRRPDFILAAIALAD